MAFEAIERNTSTREPESTLHVPSLVLTQSAGSGGCPVRVCWARVDGTSRLVGFWCPNRRNPQHSLALPISQDVIRRSLKRLGARDRKTFSAAGMILEDFGTCLGFAAELEDQPTYVSFREQSTPSSQCRPLRVFSQ